MEFETDYFLLEKNPLEKTLLPLSRQPASKLASVLILFLQVDYSKPIKFLEFVTAWLFVSVLMMHH